MNGFPTTNQPVRSSAIYRTFENYRINKLIFIQFVLQLMSLTHKMQPLSHTKCLR